MANYYPPVGFYFKVIFSHPSGSFSSETSFKEISGLSVDPSSEEIVSGGDLDFKHRLPTTHKVTNITLKRGLITDSKLREWIIKGINEFSFTPITVTIHVLGAATSGREDQKGLPKWTVHDALPVKWDVARFDSQTNEVAVESLELTFSYLDTN